MVVIYSGKVKGSLSCYECGLLGRSPCVGNPQDMYKNQCNLIQTQCMKVVAPNKTTIFRSCTTPIPSKESCDYHLGPGITGCVYLCQTDYCNSHTMIKASVSTILAMVTMAVIVHL
jgi:hypothetical protein